MAGHGIAVGALTNKVVMTKVFCKSCIVCRDARTKNVVPKVHDCPMNFEEGLSKSMEPEAILEIVKDIYHKSGGKVYVSPLTMDDNATSRAYLKHASDDARNKGKLSPEIPEPVCLSDLNHCLKGVSGNFFQLAKLPKKISTCTRLDAL